MLQYVPQLLLCTFKYIVFRDISVGIHVLAGTLQVGSADHHIHYYDLRNISQPLHIFSGHRKAVSYVKFLSDSELASASTDSTLRLWDVKENVPVRPLLVIHFLCDPSRYKLQV